MVIAQLDEQDDAMSRGFKKVQYNFSLHLDTPLHELHTLDNTDKLGDKTHFFQLFILSLIIGGHL